ncbi:hypothetical protein HY994_04680 [Candidatus Micrarchaeota archaeon]|nr:hypothetical protein [Candidatus Micrarchaeota archaeon]
MDLVGFFSGISNRAASQCRPFQNSRTLFFLILFLALPFSSGFYPDPPHAQVAEHNDALGLKLLGVRLPLEGNRPKDSPLRSFTVSLHSVYPSVDQTISAIHPTSVLWGWTYDAQSNYDWDRALGYSCGANRTRMVLSGTSGRFWLHSLSDGGVRSVEVKKSPVSVGWSVSELSSSKKPLSVWLDGNLTLHYYTDDEIRMCRTACFWGSCNIQTWVETTHRVLDYPYVATSSTVVAPIVHPVNRTVFLNPWISNYSVFLPNLQAYLFSNTTSYRVSSSLDGSIRGRRRYLDFEIRSDSADAWSVWTLANDSTFFLTPDDRASDRVEKFAAKNFSWAIRAEQSLDSRTSANTHRWTVTAYDVFGDAIGFSVNVSGHASVRLAIRATPNFVHPFQTVPVRLSLRNFFGDPLSGQPLVLESAGNREDLFTDSDGFAYSALTFDQPGAYRILARFPGADGLSAAFADSVVTVGKPPSDGMVVARRYDGLLLGLVLLLSLAMVRFR